MTLRTIVYALAIVLMQGVVEATEKKLHQHLPSPTESPISERAKRFITLHLTDTMFNTSTQPPKTPSPQNSHSDTRVGDPQQPAAPASPVAAGAPPSGWCARCCKRTNKIVPAP